MVIPSTLLTQSYLTTTFSSIRLENVVCKKSLSKQRYKITISIAANAHVL